MDDMCMIKFILCQHTYKEDNYRKHKLLTSSGCTWEGSYDSINDKSKKYLSEVEQKKQTRILTCYEYKYIHATDVDIKICIKSKQYVLKKGHSVWLWTDDVQVTSPTIIHVYDFAPQYCQKWGVKVRNYKEHCTIMLNDAICINANASTIRATPNITCNTFVYNETGKYRCDICVIMRAGVRTIKYHLHSHDKGVLRLARVMKTCNLRRMENILGNITTFTVNCNLLPLSSSFRHITNF